MKSIEEFLQDREDFERKIDPNTPLYRRPARWMVDPSSGEFLNVGSYDRLTLGYKPENPNELFWFYFPSSVNHSNQSYWCRKFQYYIGKHKHESPTYRVNYVYNFGPEKQFNQSDVEKKVNEFREKKYSITLLELITNPNICCVDFDDFFFDPRNLSIEEYNNLQTPEDNAAYLHDYKSLYRKKSKESQTNEVFCKIIYDAYVEKWFNKVEDKKKPILIAPKYQKEKPKRPTRTTTKAIIPQRVSLYRMYGNCDDLLYVGISNSFTGRFNQHNKDKPWLDQVSNVKTEWFVNREDAINVEKHAIINEKPKYNIIHNRNGR